MELRRDFLLGLGTLVVLNLLFAFGSIALFGRMAPAIERILEQNVYSIEAVEDMAMVLADSRGQPVSAPERERFRHALQRARDNVTEEAERPTLAEIARLAPPALDGDDGAARSLVPALRKLSATNRAAMAAADRAASRLGAAGAWAAVFIALFSFALSLLVLRRLERRIVEPVLDLARVLEEAVATPQRRCRESSAPVELKRALLAANRLLDERLVGATAGASRKSSEDRALVLALLEREQGPALIGECSGSILAANAAALDRLAEQGEEVRAELPRLADLASAYRGRCFDAVPLKESLWLCTLHFRSPAL